MSTSYSQASSQHLDASYPLSGWPCGSLFVRPTTVTDRGAISITGVDGTKTYGVEFRFHRGLGTSNVYAECWSGAPGGGGQQIDLGSWDRFAWYNLQFYRNAIDNKYYARKNTVGSALSSWSNTGTFTGTPVIDTIEVGRTVYENGAPRYWSGQIIQAMVSDIHPYDEWMDILASGIWPPNWADDDMMAWSLRGVDHLVDRLNGVALTNNNSVTTSTETPGGLVAA